MIEITILGLVCVALIVVFIRHIDSREDAFETERQQWREERQQLLDRIQAPSYDHLKHHEVKVIKAQKEQPEKTINLEVV